MSGVRRLALTRPPTRGPVVELGVANRFGRWMRQKGWLAFTLPLPLMVIVFYWLKDEGEQPDPFTRVHEFVHVRQAERLAFFSVRYLWALLADRGYRRNRFEVEAFRVEAAARREGLPAWAELSVSC
jgi:hypothetical protein